LKIIVLGCGNIGSVVGKDLAESLPSTEIVMADINKDQAEKTVTKINRNNVSWIQIDASSYRKLTSTLKKFDLAVSALPGSMGFQSCKASIAAGVDMVDFSYMPEDAMTLNKQALKANVCVIPDCGMSPGLSNILVGHALSNLNRIKSIHIFTGGLPEKPVPPLGYVMTWSIHDLIEVYSRRVNLVKESKITQVEAMSGLKEITIPKVGRLEAFYTDGLRTLLHTVADAEEMWEKTLRYPGHIEKIKLLKEFGFFDEKPITIGNTTVTPRELTARLLEKKLKMPEIRDVAIVFIETFGAKDGREIKYIYRMLDHYDEKHRVTAMARTTAYTASVITKLIASKTIKEKGIIPPEKLGMNNTLYKKFWNEMKKRGIKVEETMKTLP
jgi:lysine 6-dehydrogenase